MESQILPLEWPSGKDVTEVTAFETSARQKRYLALGQACHTSQLAALLTGHHLDDNVETAILRLTQCSGRQGLTGIAPLSRIPECQHVWGISGSGRFEKIKGRGASLKHVNPEISKSGLSFDMAAGGAMLCRPLLPYTKSRILETCKNLQIPYVNDPTNFDKTLTVRNTIRSLLSSNKLPRALQAPSIEAFLSRNRASLHELMEQTDSLLRTCQLHEFIAGSSTMKIQFPVLHQTHALMSPERDSRLLSASLRRITELISPLQYKSLPLQKYAALANAIFTGQQLSDFSVGGAHFRLLSARRKGTKNVWHVTRVPFIAYSAPDIVVSELHNERFSTPVLWDSRYWLQFRLRKNTKIGSSTTVLVRSLEKEDMIPISNRLEACGYSKEVFSVMAPYKSRFTLPVVTAMRTSDGTINEKYLALPTLGLDLSKGTDLGIQCKWGYMAIDVDALKLLGWLASDYDESIHSEGLT